MHVQERVRILEDWSQRLSSLTGEVWLTLDEFVPYGGIADKYASAVEELHDMLEMVSDFATARLKEAEAEEGRWLDAWDMYRAWERGLCPSVMEECLKDYRHISDAGNTDNWSEIAEYLQESEMSRADTENAVRTWRWMKSVKEAV